jgi:hypothetical protein
MPAVFPSQHRDEIYSSRWRWAQLSIAFTGRLIHCAWQYDRNRRYLA